jgi:superfamily II DNA or RNA helicase
MTNGDRPLRTWQKSAIEAWRQQKRRGIVAVVTGGGKTIFALHCLREFRNSVPAATALIVVPTEALLDQWVEEIVSFLGIPLSQIVVLNARSKIALSRIHIGVINSVATLADKHPEVPVFLIVDECHKAASPVFRKIFQVRTEASLGLSATPERPYDSGLEDVLVPNVGPVIFRYTYQEALADGVIVPFRLHNIVFEFEAEERKKYDRLTRGIQACITKFGFESPETIALLLRRSRLSNSSPRRVEVTLRLVARHKGQRILIFHEDIASCEVIANALVHFGISAEVYHSKVPLSARVKTLQNYRAGRTQVLVSCRALDEGFNVPETEIGIIAASTATERQRIQRLGRILRPAKGKAGAIIYSIVAAQAEIKRLTKEEETMEGVAEVKWSKV